MFAYCNNNPTSLSDKTGLIATYCMDVSDAYIRRKIDKDSEKILQELNAACDSCPGSSVTQPSNTYYTSVTKQEVSVSELEEDINNITWYEKATVSQAVNTCSQCLLPPYNYIVKGVWYTVIGGISFAKSRIPDVPSGSYDKYTVYSYYTVENERHTYNNTIEIEPIDMVSSRTYYVSHTSGIVFVQKVKIKIVGVSGG